MSDNPADFWTSETSVFFTSFWGWTPETWGTVGWTGQRGKGRRKNLLAKLTDPFIAVIYVTGDQDNDAELRGRIAGFYLMSHEMGDRNRFTHPLHYKLEPKKWRHSLRAIRAFSYLPEYRISVSDLDPDLLDRARSIAAMGDMLTDPKQIELLRSTHWEEVDVYLPVGKARVSIATVQPLRGFNRAGPTNQDAYVVSSSGQQLKRHLYILVLGGDTSAYLGKAADGKRIYKIGLSASPELRKEALQSGMPEGAFSWKTHKTSAGGGRSSGFSFDAAVAGEYAMKKHLSKVGEWLGGEFYLANESEIRAAWRLANEAAKSFEKK